MDKEYQWIPDISDALEAETELKAEHLGYQLVMFKIPEIWKEFGVRGKGIKVGVGDTGVSKNHLEGELNGVKKATSSFGDDGFDKNSHGSHCIGIISMRDDDQGAVGVAPGVEVHSHKLLRDNGSGPGKAIAEGIVEMADNGCQIISLSIGASVNIPEIASACKYAHDKGVILVAANGNDGRKNDVDYPGALPWTLSVAACDWNLQRARFSDMGKQTDCIAPGVRIFSTSAKRYVEMSGTSQATPFVAGCWALALEAEIKFHGEQLTHNATEARAVMSQFSLDTGPSGKDPANGYGAWDVQRYIRHLWETRKDDPPEESKDLNYQFKSATQKGNEFLIRFQKTAVLLVVGLCVALTSFVHAQVPVPEPQKYEDPVAQEVISRLTSIEAKVDRIDQTTQGTNRLVHQQSEALAKALEGQKSLIETSSKDTDRLIEAIKELNQPTKAVTQVKYRSVSSPRWRINGKVWTRSEIITHLTNHANHRGKYELETLEEMTIGQLWALHDDDHDSRVLDVGPVDPGFGGNPGSPCPGGICPTFQRTTYRSRAVLFPNAPWNR